MTGLRNALGSYAGTADAATFCTRPDKRRGSEPREDLARLEGLRFVAVSEAEEGDTFAAAFVKALFGGDTVTARHLYQATREWRPKLKVLLMTNHRLRARADDEAFWRRIAEVPFTASLPLGERKPAVKETLTDPAEAGPAILAWAVAGAVEWYRVGLRTPAAVQRATGEYRASQDPLRDFLADACVIDLADPEAEMRAGDLRGLYEGWSREQGSRHLLVGKAFGTHLRAAGCTDFRRDGARWWRGIRPRRAEDDTAAPESDPMPAMTAPPVTSPYARARGELWGQPSFPSFRHGRDGPVTPADVLQAVLDAGGSIIADPERPRLAGVPEELKPLVQEHRKALRALVLQAPAPPRLPALDPRGVAEHLGPEPDPRSVEAVQHDVAAALAQLRFEARSGRIVSRVRLVYGVPLGDIRRLLDLYETEGGAAAQLRQVLDCARKRLNELLDERAAIDATVAATFGAFAPTRCHARSTASTSGARGSTGRWKPAFRRRPWTPSGKDDRCPPCRRRTPSRSPFARSSRRAPTA